MKPLLSASQMGKVKYPLDKLTATRYKAELLCIYDKYHAKTNKHGKTLPTSLLLRLKNIDATWNISDMLDANEVLSDNILCYETPQKKEKFITKLYLFGDEIDTDNIYQKPYPIYPPGSLYKTISVNIAFAGLDMEGKSVWKIVLD